MSSKSGRVKVTTAIFFLLAIVAKGDNANSDRKGEGQKRGEENVSGKLDDINGVVDRRPAPDSAVIFPLKRDEIVETFNLDLQHDLDLELGSEVPDSQSNPVDQKLNRNPRPKTYVGDLRPKQNSGDLDLDLGDYPFRNVSLTWEERVDNLVSLLTLDEIQLQMARGGHGPTVSPAPPIPRLGVGPYSWNTECLRGDADAGPATSFPMPIGLAATFSSDLVERVARATGQEVRAKYNNYTKHGLYGDHRGLSCFSPVINIMRDPRWGRNQETYGEDPYLSGVLATSFVQGLQGNDSRYVLANSGCKHFDVHGGPEDIPQSRLSFDAKVSDRDWHMTFLPAFKACVDAGTYNVMCSYNSINGIPACANRKLLTEILRESWNFMGYVISDETALENIVEYHHYVSNYVEAAAVAVTAGVSLEISGHLADNVFMQIVSAVNQGLLDEPTVRERVKPLFYTRMRLGEFDPPEMNPYTGLDVSIVQSPAHQKLSLEVAKKSFVLLKNKNGFLPIQKSFGGVAVVGPLANSTSLIYGEPWYTPTINLSLTVTPLQGLSKLGQKLWYADGCSDVSCNTYDSNSVINAVSSGADVVFVCLGTGQMEESEGHDKPDLELPGKQMQLLMDAVTHSKGVPVVLLMFNAGPLNVTWADQNALVSAILELGYPGQTTGTALLEVLTNKGGDSSPAGRLPATWPLYADQIPDMVNYSMSGRTYRYSDSPSLYPFGYGLSYTQFVYAHLMLEHDVIAAGDTLHGSVTLENVGSVNCDEVVQVYIKWGDSSLPAPRLELAWFERTATVQARGQRIVKFSVSAQAMALWLDSTQGWIVSPGKMTVYVGGQQPDQTKTINSNVLSQDFTITGHKQLGLH